MKYEIFKLAQNMHFIYPWGKATSWGKVNGQASNSLEEKRAVLDFIYYVQQQNPLYKRIYIWRQQLILAYVF